MIEEWKSVPGHEGQYEVSNLGRVRSLERYRKTKGGGVCKVPARILKQAKANTGYLVVGLGGKYCTVHRLVLETFVGPALKGRSHCCHHPDPDPTNNRVDNLRWGSPHDNAGDRKQHGGYATGEKHHGSKLTDKERTKLIQLYTTGKWSQPKLAERFGIAQSTVWSILKRAGVVPLCKEDRYERSCKWNSRKRK